MPKGIYKRRKRSKSVARKSTRKARKSGNKKVKISGSRILYGARK